MSLGASAGRRAARLLVRLWAAPCTALGLLLALPALAAGARLRRRLGALEVAFDDDARVPRGLERLPFDAITFGHVVLARTQALQHALRPHERVHVAQYERWGPLFLLAYPACSAALWLAGRDAWRDNPFEVQARRRAPRRRPSPGRGPIAPPPRRP